MLETLRRYWIAMLVLVMIGLHASIVGLIRYQASMAKIDASCEVELGNYLAFQAGRQAPISMRLYAIVPINHRMKSRQLIELNQAQIRQSLEEHLRQIDSRVLTDPYLADLKSQLLDVMVQTIGNSSIDDLVITELHEPKGAANLEFVSRGAPNTPRQLVATLRAQSGDSESDEHDESHGDAEGEGHGDSPDHGEENSHESSQTSAHKTSGHAPLKSNSHGASKSSSHGAAKSSGHGAAKSSGHGAAKSSGHGASKASSHGGSGHGSSGHGASSSKKPAAKSGH